MKTSRYSPLVKLKRKSLDQAERSLVAINNEVADMSERLQHSYQILSTLSLPEKGSVPELYQANMMIQTQYAIIERDKEALESAEERQRILHEQFHEARIEYEKFKYLEVQEVNQKIKLAKQADEKMLDEIGTMTYKREKA